MAAAAVGGTVSELSGGKFANGAATGAMVHLFNAETKSVLQEEQNRLQIQKYASGLQTSVHAGDLTSKEAFALVADYAATLYTDLEEVHVVYLGSFTTLYDDMAGFVDSLFDVLADYESPYYVPFTASGFAPELVDTSNQVRHAMTGIRSGYQFGAATGKSIMDFYERRFSDNQPKDYILNVRATRIGELLTAPGARPADLSSWIRKEF